MSASGSGTAALELLESTPGAFAARGALTFATARAARETGLSALGGGSAQAVEVDCSAISSSDSAGMTVLLDWLTFARRRGRSLHFVNLPSQLQAIARISDVLELMQKGV